MAETDGWTQYEKLVLSRLDGLDAGLKDVTKKVDELVVWKAGQVAVNDRRREFTKTMIGVMAIVATVVVGLASTIATLVWLAVS